MFDFFVCFFCLLEGWVIKIILVLSLIILLYVLGVWEFVRYFYLWKFFGKMFSV